jgi:hypothetical protein
MEEQFCWKARIVTDPITNKGIWREEELHPVPRRTSFTCDDGDDLGAFWIIAFESFCLDLDSASRANSQIHSITIKFGTVQIHNITIEELHPVPTVIIME